MTKNARKGFRGFTLVELVVVIGVIGILSAVLIPTFAGIINNSKLSAKYERAQSARNDYFLEDEDLEALGDMRDYLILVDGTLYIIDEDGNLSLSDFDYEDYEEDGDYEEVQRAYDDDDSIRIFRPRALDAYGRALKARNDYRRTNLIDKNYFEMDNYIIEVTADDGVGLAYFRVVFDNEESLNNGAIYEIEENLDLLYIAGYEYVHEAGNDTWYGLIYKPTELTQLTYRIDKIEEELLGITHNDENKKEGDFIYVVNGIQYVTDENGIVRPLEEGARKKVTFIDASDEEEYEDSELRADGFQNIQTNIINASLRSKITEKNKDLIVYKAVLCYGICYGYYDTADTYHNWTEYRKVYGSETEINEIVYKSGRKVSGIKTLILSDTITGMGYGALVDYEDLESVIIPETVTEIVANPITNGKTTDIRIHYLNPIYSDYDHRAIVRLSETGSNDELIAGTKALLDETNRLPESIQLVNEYAFEKTTITEIDVTNLAVDTGVEKGAFKDCVYLISVSHNFEKIIPDEIFSGCISLEYFTMPEMVEVIGKESFKNCVTLASVELGRVEMDSDKIQRDESIPALREIRVGAFDGTTMTLYYADSRKTFQSEVTANADLTKVHLLYAIKDITYVLENNEAEEVEGKPNPVKLNPLLDNYLVLTTPSFSYKWKFLYWSVKGTYTGNVYPNIVAGSDLSNPYKFRESDYNEDITFTANYERIVFDIVYKVDGTDRTNDLLNVDKNTLEFTYEGEFAKEYNTTVSDTINVPQLDKVGYTFDGWYIGQTRISEDGSTLTQYGRRNVVTLTAKFTVIIYTIKYDYDIVDRLGNSHSGTVAKANPTEYTVESQTFELNNPTMQDFKFIGWTGTNGEDPQMVVQIAHGSIGNREYYANYESLVYNLTYNLNKGTLATPNPSTFTVDMDPITMNEPTRKGYTFKGWNDGIKNIGTNFVCADYHTNITLTAMFEPNVYNITFTGAHVSNFNNATTYTYDTTVTLRNPDMDNGYRFVEWYEANGYVQGSYLIGAYGDITIEAKVDVVIYTISYNLNVGIVNGTNPTQYHIESSDITLINPTRIGYKFLGWTGSNGNNPSTIVTILKGSTGNKNYTANWELITYTITYILNGGTVVGNPTEFTYESSDIVISNPTRVGYDFTGWTGTGLNVNTMTIKIPNHSIDNRTYTANWSAIVYTLSYTLNGGSATNKANYTIETPTFKLNNPTRSGYDFAGWTGTDITGKSSSVEIRVGSIGNRSFTATWTAIIYKLTYNLNGGTVATTNPTTYTIETATFTLNNPARTGYTFSGWTGANGTTAQTTIQIAKGSIGDRNYEAKWAIITYNLTYTLNNGTATNPSTYNVETATIVLNNPTRKGYTFNGWSGTGITGMSTSVSITKGSTGNRSYTANFTRNTYTIEYVLNNGTVNGTNPVTFHVESATINIINPTKNGYTFNGWSGTGISGMTTSLSIPTGSVDNRKYTANFTPITYTITYNLNGGSATNPTTFTIETAQFTLATPTRAGYNFAGWSGTGITGTTDSITINKGSTGNRTYTASWTIITYTIGYTLNGGQVATTNKTSYTVETETFTLNNPTRTGYNFDGWTGSNGTTKQTTVTISKGSTGNRTYTANFTVITYTITYTLNGGTQSSPKTSYTVNDSAFTLVNPTRTGYNFDGWTGSNGTSKQVTVIINTGSTGNRSYTANWSTINYTITYTLNGGTQSSPKTSYTIETATFTLVNPTRTGYTFAGWTGSNGTTKQTSVQIAKGSTGNKSYTANWTVVTYTISYTLNGGTNNSSNPSSYTIESNTFYIYAPSRAGYTFAGWSGSGSGTGTITITKGSRTGNLTFTASWTALKYTVTLNQQSGSGGISSVTATYGSAMPSATKPSRTGYTFGGYYTSTGGSGTCYYNASMGSARNWNLTANTTLYAKWTSITTTVTLNKQSGSGGTASVTAQYGFAMPSASAPSRTGYTFGGYYTSTGGSGTQYYNASMGSARNWDSTASTYTLYAKWTTVTYTISYNYNGGSNPGNKTSYTVETASFTLVNPTRAYYNFTGWSGSGSGTSVTIAKGSTGNRSYTANWAARNMGSRSGSMRTSGSYSSSGTMVLAWSVSSYSETYTTIYWECRYELSGWMRLGLCYMDAYGARRWTRNDNVQKVYAGVKGSGSFTIYHTKCTVSVGFYLACSIYYGTAYNQTASGTWTIGN